MTRHTTHQTGATLTGGASLATVDPMMQLAAAVCAASIKDLQSSDPIVFTDALTWLLSDGPLYLQVLGFSVNELTILQMVQTGGLEHASYGEPRRILDRTSRTASRNDAARADGIPGAAG